MLRRRAKSANLAGLTLSVKYHRQNRLESFQPTQKR